MPAGRPGIGEEFVGGQVGTAQIAFRQARPGDAQFADFAARQQAQGRGRSRAILRRLRIRVGIDDQQAVVGQRRADGDRLARLQTRQAGRHRGLGRAVGIEHLPARPGPAFDQRFRAHLAAQVNQAQRRHLLVEQGQQGRHRVQHGDVVLGQHARQCLRVAADLLGSQPQGRTDQIGDPDLFE